jgi:predicted Zn-dependent protease with MMP-like domain
MEPEDLNAELEKLYEAANLASAEGHLDEALARCKTALEMIEEFGEESETYNYSDFLMLIGDVHWGAGDYEQAYQAYQKVSLHDPERLDARVAVGVALFHLCRFVAAQAQLEMCNLEDPGNAESWYYLGLSALRRGQREVAMRHFVAANELEEERYLIPEEIPEEEVIRIVSRMLDSFPAELRRVLANVPVIVESFPSEELLFSEDTTMDPLILGLFDGVPITEVTSDLVVTSPTRILLFYENIALLASDRKALEDELWVTLKHEVGHFLGLNEEELAERGLD